MNTENPYISAKREWNEKYGSFMERERTWKMVSFLSLMIATICASGLFWSANQSKLIPYVVEVDSLKRASSRGYATEMKYKKNNIIKSELVKFIEDTRSVITDDIVQKKIVNNVYTRLGSDSPATQYLNEFFKKNNPFKRSENYTVSLEVTNILQASKLSWQVEWTEVKRDLQGKILGKIPMKAFLTLIFRDPQTEEEIISNPLGLYVKELSWSKILS